MTNVTVEPRIERIGRLLIAGLRYEGRNQHGEIPAMWEVFFTRMGELGISAGRPRVYYGVGRSIPGVPEGDGFEYLAGVEVRSAERVPPGMTLWEIPPLTYAVLEAHDIAEIGPVCDAFYVRWLPRSAEYRAGEPLMLERYPASFPTARIVELCFPVEPK